MPIDNTSFLEEISVIKTVNFCTTCSKQPIDEENLPQVGNCEKTFLNNLDLSDASKPMEKAQKPELMPEPPKPTLRPEFLKPESLLEHPKERLKNSQLPLIEPDISKISQNLVKDNADSLIEKSEIEKYDIDIDIIEKIRQRSLKE
jgi:hypothetical protein